MSNKIVIVFIMMRIFFSQSWPTLKCLEKNRNLFWNKEFKLITDSMAKQRCIQNNQKSGQWYKNIIFQITKVSINMEHSFVALLLTLLSSKWWVSFENVNCSMQQNSKLSTRTIASLWEKMSFSVHCLLLLSKRTQSLAVPLSFFPTG